ncbi:hypothetical protein GCM10011282_18580 [Undibacterium macrobrachii]|jgi:hypothetical protein|uniref:EF-hand domain-containing protein n=1 Tax=Undibacterium macrobrachii TaxID=1119058 RepID=A0ABQ2XDX2_9BURK|nr:hypothetical protein GCM10011282_18580 [Undibacterium macrobrachii]
MEDRSPVISRAGKAIAFTALSLVGCYWALFGWMVYSSPLLYTEMDLNRDGKVELFEVDYASSFGERSVERAGLKCIEYFAYKDGLPLKVVCPK